MPSPIVTSLARLRGYGATALISAVEPLNDGPLFLIPIGIRFVAVLVMLAIWRDVLGAHPGAAGMPLGAVLAYTLLAQALAPQLNFTSDLGEHLWDGSILGRFLWPQGLVAQVLATTAGRWVPDLALGTAPMLLGASLLHVSVAPASPIALAAFLLSLGLAITVGLAIDFAFTALTVSLRTTIWLIEQIRNATTALLSGGIIPLALMPWGLGGVFGWLPFAATASAPLRIYTGTGPILPLLAGQLLWALVLWPAVWLLWTRNREKVAGYGG
ncbi:MAG TPA: hypothetical protein VIA06_15050 [Candidatus Dormibacteraeota bacterium]|nr:hypothetical protein [Candidatus Dormibacteraeota bacterium]